jgi:hypothetical protein
MVLSDTAWDWSSGAIGMAWDAEIAAKPSPIANADAAKIFMNVPFLGWYACTQQIRIETKYAMAPLPVTAVPVAAMPMPVPAPMVAAPAPVTVVPVPMPVVAPAHFLRLQMIDFVVVGDGRMGIPLGGEPSVRAERLRRQRRGLGGGGNGRGARNYT